MKVSITEPWTRPCFEPIKLEITIESKEELQELYHRFNSEPSFLYRQYEQMAADKILEQPLFDYGFAGGTLAMGMWSKLYATMKNRNIKP